MSNLEQNSKWRGRISRYAPLLICIGVIFYLSSGQGSMDETSQFLGPLLRFLFPAAPPETILQYHGYIRKFAHFAEYAAAASLASRAFYTSSVSLLRDHWFIAAGLLIVLVASLDELNQSFEPSRTGSMRDVLLDCSGGLTAIVIIYILRKLHGRASSSV